MNIFNRALDLKLKRIDNVVILNRSITTKDLFINDIVAINFIVGQEIYFFIFKAKDKNLKNSVLSSREFQDVIDENTKAISIELFKLKDNQFKDEQKIINKFIRQVGVSNAEKLCASF